MLGNKRQLFDKKMYKNNESQDIKPDLICQLIKYSTFTVPLICFER